MRTFLALIAVAWLAMSGHAFAFGMGAGNGAQGNVVTTCPQLLYNDGCTGNGASPNGTGTYVRSNFATYAQQSGQATSSNPWTASHPQPHNMAGVDFGVGPTVAVSTMADIAHWGDGTIPGTNCGQASGTTCGCTYYDGTIAQWTSGQPTGWVATWPALACTSNITTPVTFTGWNFGPTAFQGSPKGSHDCINLVFYPVSGILSVGTVTIKNNAFINGAACAPITTINYGMITSSKSGFTGKYVVYNNFIDGRNSNPCCVSNSTTSSGIWFSLSANQDDVDVEYNWIQNTPLVSMLASPSHGSETANCQNGTSYGQGSPGYNLIFSRNYVEGIGYAFGSGHWELMTNNLQANTIMCEILYQFNTVLWTSTSAAEGTTSFYGNANAASVGTTQLFEADHNTIVVNLTGGKKLPALYEFYDWHTNGNALNEIVIDNAGSSCGGNYPGTSIPISCPVTGGVSPAVGAYIQGGTNNVNGSTQNTVGLRAYDAGTSAYGGGCNQQSADGGTLCPNNSPYASLAPSVAWPFSYNSTTKVLNSQFDYRILSVAGANAGYGSHVTLTPAVAASGGPFTGTTITLSANCPAGLFPGLKVIDTTQSSTLIGTIASCPTSGAVLTLNASAAISVANNDTLTINFYGFGQVVYTNNYMDGTGSNANTGSVQPSYWVAAPPVTGTGYLGTGAGGCATASIVQNNVELRSGSFSVTPNTYLIGANSGC